MDREKARCVFKEEITGRWPDFALSGVLMNDWLVFLMKFEPEDIALAVKRYVLNYDTFKRPSLFKFREIINVQCRQSERAKVELDTYPQYFLRCQGDCIYFKAGIFMQVCPIADDLAVQMSQVQFFRQKQEQLYGGNWNVIICNNREDIGILIKDRTDTRVLIGVKNDLFQKYFDKRIKK